MLGVFVGSVVFVVFVGCFWFVCFLGLCVGKGVVVVLFVLANSLVACIVDSRMNYLMYPSSILL